MLRAGDLEKAKRNGMKNDRHTFLVGVVGAGPIGLAAAAHLNLHSCGTVRPHGYRELQHPEARFYMVGAKSYGRAPNFLLVTGHEQVRSVVAALAGDLAAADNVQLELPETGVCSTRFDEASSSGCWGGPPTKMREACCVKDELAKEAGASGCGCSP